MTRLSVNINKIATLRNARGGDRPDVIQAAIDCQRFGAQGITVHPRPDERHIRKADVRALRPVVRTELNIEGNPTPAFIDLVCEVRPEQVTLVPDAPNALTSNAGWDAGQHHDFLTEVCRTFRARGIRTSIFIDPMPAAAAAAAACGADRVELYTAAYAAAYPDAPEQAIAPYVETARAAADLGLGLNAGHDLSLENLAYFVQRIPWTDEVSIGHALICDALYLGLEQTVRSYLAALR